MENNTAAYGYCHIVIEPRDGRKLLRSNSERAFIIAQLQDLLSPRLVLGDIPAYRQLASCVDLLAFSISHTAIHLLVFTIDTTIASDFAHRLLARLTQFQYEYRPPHHRSNPDVSVSVEHLVGPHQALAHSVVIHQLHHDWEYDRYSSIGFYLHDRRGDWMRIWRLTSLYDNEPAHYYELMLSGQPTSPAEPNAYPLTVRAFPAS